MFEAMKNAAILCQYCISYNFELLMNKEVGNQMKVKSTTWYSHFLMTQHNNQRWA